MPQSKPHLLQIHRHALGESRQMFLRLDMNENPDGLPEAFVRSVLDEVTPKLLASYPVYEPLKAKIAAADGVEPDEICLAAGSDGAIKLLFEAYVRPGDNILLTNPTFAMYPVYASLAQAQVVSVGYGQDLRLPMDAFLAQVRPGVRLGVLVNPNNPTGQALSPGDIERGVAALAEVDALAVVDEAYYQYHGYTALPLLSKYPNLVVLRTFSKLCGLASARVGYVAARRDVVTALRTVRSSFEVNALGALFAERLLDRPDILAEEMQGFRQGKAFLVNALQGLGAECMPGEANFVLIRCPGGPAEAAAFLKQRKILVASGFGHPAVKDCIRVTVGKQATMEAFMKVFQEYVLAAKA